MRNKIGKYAIFSILFTMILSGCSDDKKPSVSDKSEIINSTSEIAVTTDDTTDYNTSDTSVQTITTKLTSDIITTSESVTKAIDESTTVSEDVDMLALAQELYDVTCGLYFGYHVGCPYELDYDVFIENEYNWPFYLVTEEGYNSLEDIENDYFEWFSRDFGSDLDQLYIEKDGRVYALSGERGKNILYEYSEVTSIISETENEIVFEVQNHYSDDDRDTVVEPVVKTERFSIILKGDKTYIGEFKMPY